MRRPASRRGNITGCVLAGAAALALSGCTTSARTDAAAHRPARCVFATCETDAPSLAKVTAKAVGVQLESVAIVTAEPQFNGAVLVWRATVSGKPYACKEGRDAATGVVHYVTCQPSNDTGPLKAFP